MLSSIAMVGLAYNLRGRWKEAEELEVQVMETSARVLGEEHPSTLTSMANLAHFWAPVVMHSHEVRSHGSS